MRAVALALGLVIACAAAAPGWAQPAPAKPPQRAWLGVFIRPGLHGVYVQEIIDQSPAEITGLEVGDELLAVSGQRVNTPTELIAAIDAHPVGATVELTLWRSGRVLRREAVLDAKPDEEDILHRRLVGKRAPELRAPTVSGDAIGDLGRLRGRVVLLLFAASGCESCASLHRRLSRFVDRNADSALAAFLISRESRSSLSAWADSHKPSFTVLHDVGGGVAGRYYVTQEPTVMVIDRDSTVLYVGIGGEDRLEIAAEVAGRALARGAI
ncbi:redoxin domain-containing protein [Haliangium sp.]|uniref:peroxiredoxin family protein n=1 Tax=Haliangium sp. TaxID=2663208 RepID=UPI003D10C012